MRSVIARRVALVTGIAVLVSASAAHARRPWTQAIDGIPGCPDDDLADTAREAIYHAASERLYVYGFGATEDDAAMDHAFTGFVRSYDTKKKVLAQTTRIGGTNPGKETRLFNGVIAVDPADGLEYLYVSGKTDTNVNALCPSPATPVKFPDSSSGDNSKNGIIMKFDLTTLAIVDCLMIQTAGSTFDEIASLEAGDGYLWIAGSTTGSVVSGPTALSTCAPAESDCNDAYVARISPDLNAPLNFSDFFQFGTPYFDEDLGMAYDAAHDRLLVSGSTKGELCLAYPAPPCTHGFGIAGTHNNFDSYIASLAWNGGGFALKWVYQFGEGAGMGSDDNDVAHDIVLHTDASTATSYLYETGYAPGGAATDFRISRISLNAMLAPEVIGGVVSHVTMKLDSLTHHGDNGATLYDGDQYIWASATMNGGEDHAHGGPCGSGNGTSDTSDPADGTFDDSLNEGHIFGFLHASFGTAVAPDKDLRATAPQGDAWVSRRSVSLEGLTWANGKFWATGSTTAGFNKASTAACGTATKGDYDDETDAVVFKIRRATP